KGRKDSDCSREITLRSLAFRKCLFKEELGFDMKLIILCLLATLTANAQTAKPTYPVQDEIRALFVRFVAAQNAHDGDTVGSMIWDSPDFLWVSRGNPVRGSQQAIANFRSYYKGTWHLEPDMTRFSVTP